MENKVSIWIGKNIIKEDDDRNILKEFWGVEDYEEDFEEINFAVNNFSTIRDLAEPLSFSESFVDNLENEAEKEGLKRGGYIIALYDYAYKKEIKETEEAVFLGVFDYIEDFLD